MSIIDSLSVSVSGMTAQRQRVNTISENLANANTTRTPQGGPYRRREVIFAAVANARKFEDELRAQERSLDTATQVKVNLMEASRSYEANVAAFNASKSMWQSALDLGRGMG